MDNTQSESGSLNIAVLLFVYSPEGVKNVGYALLFYPLTGIFHRIPDAYTVDCLTFTSNREGNSPFAGILHRIAQQVDQNLLNTHLVPTKHTWDGGIHLQLKFQSFFLRLDPYHVDDL